MTQVIEYFSGRFAFLSNFAYSDVHILLSPDPHDIALARTVEHAFNACKTLDRDERKHVLAASTPKIAKNRGRRVTLRPDWDRIVRYEVMRALIAQKFAKGTPFAEQLLATGEAKLVEGNHWGDRHWGVCDGVGENHLGRLLMAQRAELRRLED